MWTITESGLILEFLLKAAFHSRHKSFNINNKSFVRVDDKADAIVIGERSRNLCFTRAES